MGWKKRERGDFFKFEKPGDELAGTWRGTAKGKHGDNGQIETDSSQVFQFGLSAVLEELKNEQVGSRIRIVFTGMEMSAAGHEYKAFDIFDYEAEEGEEGEEGDEKTAPAPAGEPDNSGNADQAMAEEVPF